MQKTAIVSTRLGAALVVCCLVLFPVNASGFDPAKLRQRFADGVLRWGGDAEGAAPFQLRAPDDPSQIIGFEVELADALAESMGRRLGIPLKAQFTQYDWVSLPLGLERKDFDIILAGFEITPENERIVRFSRPYYRYALQMVVRQSEQGIAAIEDLRDRPVGTLAGSAAERLLQAAGVAEIVSFDGQVEPYLDLEVGRLDAVLLDAPIAAYYGLPNPNLKATGELMGHGWYAIGLRKNEADLADALDECLAELIANGKLRAIYRKWHLWNDDQVQLARGPGRAAELAGLGFDDAGQPLVANEPPPKGAVDKNIIAASAAQWSFGEYTWLLVQAAGMTVLLTVCSMALAMTLGLFVCLCRLYGPAPVRWLALVYVEFFRGIPLLLLLFFLYFAAPGLGASLAGVLNVIPEWLAWEGKISPAVMTAIVGFGMNYAAYEAEIYRSSIQSVPIGQWEAARALGMREPLAFRRIIFPQAFRTALGPMTNDFVAMFKDTSLVSVIAVRELTKEYLILSRSSFEFVNLGLVTAGLYLLMSVPLGYLSRYLEKKWTPGK